MNQGPAAGGGEGSGGTLRSGLNGKPPKHVPPLWILNCPSRGTSLKWILLIRSSQPAAGGVPPSALQPGQPGVPDTGGIQAVCRYRALKLIVIFSSTRAGSNTGSSAGPSSAVSCQPDEEQFVPQCYTPQLSDSNQTFSGKNSRYVILYPERPGGGGRGRIVEMGVYWGHNSLQTCTVSSYSFCLPSPSCADTEWE